jgi:erythromycin esterase-like protein
MLNPAYKKAAIRKEKADKEKMSAALVNAIRNHAHPLAGNASDYDPLLQRIGDAPFVFLGAASYGTHQFYRGRAEITKRLINEKNFTVVAVEADWPDAYRVNRYVRGVGNDVDAKEALLDFRYFPAWMWRNTDVVEFVEWLRVRNDSLSASAAKAGFYGLDLYNLRASMRAVLEYLDKVNPIAARKARERYACFDHAADDPLIYGYLAGTDLENSCERKAVAELLDLQRHASDDGQRHSLIPEDEFFYAEQNARLIKNAEKYYHYVFLDGRSSWNVRDSHMAETFDALVAHLARNGVCPKVVVWAHNLHIGDARATDMGQRAKFNIGQIVRKKCGQEVILAGFTTHHGTVTAASSWEGPAARMHVPAALPGSFEAMFHAMRHDFLLIWLNFNRVKKALSEPRKERTIGVIYHPEAEHSTNYFTAQLSAEFDAILYFDESRAVEPLEYTAEWKASKVPETYPFAV